MLENAEIQLDTKLQSTHQSDQDKFTASDEYPAGKTV